MIPIGCAYPFLALCSHPLLSPSFTLPLPFTCPFHALGDELLNRAQTWAFFRATCGARLFERRFAESRFSFASAISFILSRDRSSLFSPRFFIFLVRRNKFEGLEKKKRKEEKDSGALRC